MAPNNPQPHPEFPGEAGVETRGEPPFVAEDEQTRWLFSLNRMGIRPGRGFTACWRIWGIPNGLSAPWW